MGAAAGWGGRMADTQLARIGCVTLTTSKVTVTRCGLIIEGDLTFEDWLAVASEMRDVGSAWMWCWGDLLLHGEMKFGEMWSQAVEASPVAHYQPQTLMNAMWVARAFPLITRVISLSWKHHQVVAGIENARDRMRLLREAEREKLTVQELRERVREYNKRLNPTPPLPPGKFRVLYADPPWDYQNSGFEQSAASQYATMPTDDICALDIPSLVPDNAVLFLWATSPMLPDALRAMEAWGFAYKANMIWLKDRAPGMGWFLSTKHELLLIGTRGEEMHPKEKPDSALAAPVTSHSRKPEEFAELIERMYDGPYIELFARRARSEKWTVWGYEVG